MSNEQLYLKPNVVAEPLINHWYAWPYLIPPVNYAMIVTNLHMKIMRSYIQNPIIHIAAAKNPAMNGGPFINYDEDRSDDIKAMLESSINDQAQNLTQAINDLNEMLQNKGHGGSLEALYPEVPELLKGYVELVYDMNNQPSVRLIEAMLYCSPYHHTSNQSIMLCPIEKDERLSVLNTPRINNDENYFLNIDFKNSALDDLFKLKSTPKAFDSICEMLSIDNHNRDHFRQFFTTDSPSPAPTYQQQGIRWRYFGHACVLIESAEVSILIDPLISYSYTTEIERFTYADLPETLDYVLLTHNHQDHVSIETLLQIRHKTKCFIVPNCSGGNIQAPSLKRILGQIGLNNVIELGELEESAFNQGKITGLPFLGEHCDLNIPSKLAYHIKIQEHTFLFAADSNNIEPRLYEHLHQNLSDIDILFLGMECDGAPMSWVYGPLMSKPLAYDFDQSRRLTGSNAERAMGIVRQFNFKEVYIYAMGMEPWLSYISNTLYEESSIPIIETNKLLGECESLSIKAKCLFAKEEGILLVGNGCCIK